MCSQITVQVALFLFSTCFHVLIDGQLVDVQLGDHRIPYLNPLTGEAATCSSYVVAAYEHQPDSSRCVSDAIVHLSFFKSGTKEACAGLLSMLLGHTLIVSVAVATSSIRSNVLCEIDLRMNDSIFVEKNFCNSVIPISFRISVLEPHSPALQVILTDVSGVEQVRSEEFIISLLCPQILSPDFTPLDKLYSISDVSLLAASGWSDAFVSASVLVRKSRFSGSFLKIHAASYYEVFWTYKNNIAGGISAHVSSAIIIFTSVSNILRMVSGRTIHWMVAPRN
jgi:hypothetical protein